MQTITARVFFFSCTQISLEDVSTKLVAQQAHITDTSKTSLLLRVSESLGTAAGVHRSTPFIISRKKSDSETKLPRNFCFKSLLDYYITTVLYCSLGGSTERRCSDILYRKYFSKILKFNSCNLFTVATLH